ncbi:MAG: DUF3352 domain-containing protein [Cyanobacteriota bacterium]|nr:DUF3352 domain-containing protein [Cyanobacteriota bacterium]
MMKTLKSSRLPAMGAAALILIGGGVVYWLVSRESSENWQTGARYIPEEALMSVSVSTDPRQWQQLQEYGTAESQALWGESLSSFAESVATNYGYNYIEDIQPWVGEEVTIAFLPPPAELDPDAPPLIPGESPSTIAVLPISKGNLAARMFEDSTESNTWTEREYKGIDIRDGTDDADRTFSIAVLDREFLVVGNRPEALDRAIDAYRDGKSIASTPGYDRAWESSESERYFARAYFNLQTAFNALAQTSTEPISPDILAKLESQGLATFASLQPDGIAFKNLSWLKPNSETVYLGKNQTGRMAARLPDRTVMMISGNNLEQLWKDYLQGATANPLAPGNPDWLRRALKSTVDLDLEEDLLPWMTEEFALAMVPVETQTERGFPGGVVLMVQAAERQDAEAVFEKLDGVMRQKYQYQVEETTIKNRPVVKWVSLGGALTVTRGWLSDNVAFISVGAPIADLLIPNPTSSLDASERFLDSVPLELQPNNGHFYLDLDGTINAEGFTLLQLPPAQKTFVSAIESIGVTSAIQDKRHSQYDVFVKLKKEPSGEEDAETR